MYSIDGLMQKGRNSIANALELRLFWIKPSIWTLEMEREFPIPYISMTVLRWNQNLMRRVSLYSNTLTQCKLLLPICIYIATTDLQKNRSESKNDKVSQ